MSQLFVASQSGKSVNSIAMPIYINWHGNIRIMKLTVQDQKFNFWSCQYFCFGIKVVLSVPFGDKYLATNAGCFLNKRVRFERYWLLNLQFLYTWFLFLYEIQYIHMGIYNIFYCYW